MFEIKKMAYKCNHHDVYPCRPETPPFVESWGRDSIVVNSPGVVQAFRTVVGYYPGRNNRETI
jgi:hypothetical protein